MRRSIRVDPDRLPEPMAEVAVDGVLGAVNQAWTDAFGPLTPHASLLDLVDGAECAALADWLASAEPLKTELALSCADGARRWHRVTAWPADGPAAWVVSAVDIDDRAREEWRRQEQLVVRNEMLDVSVDCIKIIDLDGRVLHMNRAGREALGVTDADAEAGFGMFWLSLLSPDSARRGRRALRRAREGKRSRFAGMSVTADGTVQHWDNLLTPVLGEDGTPDTILCVSREVTRERQAEVRLRQAVETDHLTGLLNRRSFDPRLVRALGRARQDGSAVAIVLIDLDHFKHVNDAYGHAAGDRLLRVVARRLTAGLPNGAVAARIGGDEIVVMVHGVAGRHELRALVDALVEDCARPVTHKGKTLHHSMSAGCAVFPHDAGDETALLACADAALGEVKGSGRGGVALFEPAMLQAALGVADQLRTAREVVRARAVVPVYQPKVRLDTGEVVGFEALLRWRREGELMLPASLEAAFEDFDLASSLGRQMHEAVIDDLLAWRRRGIRLLPVALNVAPVELFRGDFATAFLARLRNAGLPTSAVQLEITEQALAARGAEVAITALQRLRDAGVTVVLDDFGMGHSSLARLSEYPMDGVKVDKRFVERLGRDRSALAIITAVVALGAALDAEVVAEGVETAEQRELLLGAGCVVGQGHLLDCPQPAVAVAERLGGPRAVGA